ncbi:MAG: prolyl oligopeptidase family serine peptidase [Gemmatimonadota bacterium]
MRVARQVLSTLLFAGIATSLAAQNRSALPATAPGAVKASGEKRALNIPEYARWRSIGSVAISDDGGWASYAYTQRNVDDTLFVRNLDADSTVRIPRASNSQFSDDGRWVAYIVAPPGANRQGGAVGGGRGGNQGTPSGDTTARVRRAELRSLVTGAVVSWDNAQSIAFNRGSTALMIRKGRAGGAPAAAPAATGRGGAAPAAPPTVGTDLILRHLKEGTDELIGSVSAAEFNREGTLLSYTVASVDRDGNGLFVLSTSDWSRRSLDNARADYARATWDSAGTAIAALRGVEKRGFTEKDNTLLAFTGLDGTRPTSYTIGTGAKGLSDSWVISERGTLTWSADRSKVFVALKEQEARPPVRRDSTVEETPVGNVDVFHWKDEVIQTVQMVRAQQDRNRTYTASVVLAEQKVVPLADARMQTVQINREGTWGIGRDDKEYIHDWKPQLADFYRVNTSTGERTPILKGHQRALGISPEGRHYLYWRDGHVWAYDIESAKHTNLTKAAPVSFLNVDDDHIGEKPVYGMTGFSKDGKSVILDHKYDLWQVALDGSSPPRNLTNGVGSKNAIRFRYERVEPNDDPTAPGGGGGRGGGGGGGSSTLVDLSKPVTLSAFGDSDKKAGFYELNGDALRPLVYEDRGFGRTIKAKNADRVLITRETFAEFPDYWLTDTKFSNPKRLTDANPQQSEYKWGRRILFDYKDKDGHKLQGTLAIPDDYRPGQKLPMLVNFYEKNSQNLNRYPTPRYATAPQFADYISNGYLVMQPDVYYHTGRSHTDMLNSVEAAVRKVIELGYADPKRIGLHGHSYSGQGSAYISTQSKLFAAIIAGAAATDLVADFNQLWKSSGTSQHRYDTYGQGRFGTNPYDNLALYMDQSPVFQARTMDTPLLLVHGTNDGSVEWLQAVEFYNALRFLGKPVIFLSYEGEAHGFTRYDNQYDVMVRMHQFYDHHLKGEKPVDWIASGIPFVKKKTPTGAAAQPVQLIGPGGGIGTPGTTGGGTGGRGGGPGGN